MRQMPQLTRNNRLSDYPVLLNRVKGPALKAESGKTKDRFKMPGVPAVARFRKLIDNISRLYVNARRVQLQFAWPVGSLREETGRLIVVEEQNGEMRAKYGKQLIPKLSRELTKKYGPGFSDKVLWNMRQFKSSLKKKFGITEQRSSGYSKEVARSLAEKTKGFGNCNNRRRRFFCAGYSNI